MGSNPHRHRDWRRPCRHRGVLPAVGQFSPPHPVVDIGTGELVAKGAAVNVPVTYTCGPGEIDFGYLYVELSQRTQQGRLARGYGYTDGTSSATARPIP